MDRWVTALLRYLERLIGVMFMIVTGVTLAQVCCRYALGFSLSWSHELVILMIIWIVWLAMPIGLDRMEHLTVNFITDILPSASRRVLSLINLFLCAIFFALIFVVSFPVVEAYEGMELVTIPISLNTRYYAAVVGSALSLAVMIRRIFKAGKELG